MKTSKKWRKPLFRQPESGLAAFSYFPFLPARPPRGQVKIKTITFATYMNDQVYHVILSEPAGEDKVEQFYIKADGTIVPYTAEGTASPAA